MKKLKFNTIYIIFILFTFINCNKEASNAPMVVLIPELTVISPNNAFPESEITISGKNLEKVVNIKFGDNQLVKPKKVESNSLIVDVPILKPGQINIKALTAAGESNTIQLTILKIEPPAITLTKIKGFWGTLITIKGTNMKKVTAAIFGSTKVLPKETGNDFIKVELPSLANGENGDRTVSLTLETLTDKSNTINFVGTDPPNMAMQIPGQPYAGFPFLIKGARLKLIKAIKFGDTTVESGNFFDVSDQEITLNIPSNLQSGTISMSIISDYNNIDKTITIASSNSTSLNPGNISTGPSVVGSIGIILDSCEDRNLVVFINGVCNVLDGGKVKIGGSNDCPGPRLKTISNRTFQAFTDTTNIELLFEYKIDNSKYKFTGYVMLAKAKTYEITHKGYFLKTFDPSKFLAVISLISVSDGKLLRICSPVITSEGNSLNSEGIISLSQNTNYKDCKKLDYCKECKDCN